MGLLLDIHPVAVTRPMDALREEHRELVPVLDRLRHAADAIDQASHARIRADLDDAFETLTHRLIPHAVAEDEVLYPAVARILGSPKATATMSRDHTAVVRLVDELGVLRHFAADGPTIERANDLRRVLYGLHALLTTHFAKEEEIYLPLLDGRLTADEGAQLHEGMERSAAAVRTGMPHERGR